MVGVVASILGGYLDISKKTENQSIAKRRAQDVFNILELPVQSAGVGIPSGNFDYYFEVESEGPPIMKWAKPLSVDKKPTAGHGNALRVVYSIPANTKNDSNEIVGFSGGYGSSGIDHTKKIGLTWAVPASSDSAARLDSIVLDKKDVRSFVMFAGIHMHPLRVDKTENGGQASIFTESGRNQTI